MGGRMKERVRKRWRLGWIVGYIGVLLVVGLARYAYVSVDEGLVAAGPGSRRLLTVTATATGTNKTQIPENQAEDDDDDSSDNPYPTVFFTRKQMQQGAVVLCLVGVLYMFAALAIVCDDYFVPALEVITEKLDLSEDVAGATFMAAGGSAPELFTSIIGVFVAKSNVGFGTIVGSAVFNILFVIGCCAVATRHLDPAGLPLTWWPLFRDSMFYSVALGMVSAFFWDREIRWYEAASLLALYACYVAFMKFNEGAKKKAWAVSGMKWTDLAVEMVKADDRENQLNLPQADAEEEEDDDDEDEMWHPGCPSRDESFLARGTYILFFPLNFVMWLTIPNCNKEAKKKYYVMGFLMSILWIAIFAYFMVWWAEVSARTLDIPSEVMGFTVLAAGTSVPDLITSVIVAKKGLGDMAVSSSIGSNMFDITLGLPLPWVLKAIIDQAPVSVESKSLGGMVAMLFIMLFCTIGFIAMYGWRLNILLGATSLVLYIIFVTFALLLEYDVL